MTFNLDEKTFMISGYKGDSASFTFKINTDISQYNLYFFVKKHLNDTEAKSVIAKEFKNPQNGIVCMNLTADETNSLSTKKSCFQDYYWSLKIKADNGFVQTLIPNNFNDVPVFRVYP
ncbi:MAG: hypothetical protein PHV37_03355 [Candidatus Gastranaerophilales bacterium]|nr:hypothetical protein [Candidatus Gastranaerophilales bacterium]